MTFTEVLIFSLLAGLSMFGGTALVLFYRQWVREHSVFLISFAAGVMLTIAFVNLIPQAGEIIPNTWQWVFAGFLALYVIQNLFTFHPCHGEGCEIHHLGVFSIAGLSVHSLLDGAIIAVGFEAGHALGILTTVAVLLHKMPDGITITSVLLHTQMKTPGVIKYSAVVALATPVGAIVAFFFLRGIHPHTLGWLLSVTAGFFIYLAGSDLLPETHKKRHRANTFFFFSGIAVILAVARIIH